MYIDGEYFMYFAGVDQSYLEDMCDLDLQSE